MTQAMLVTPFRHLCLEVKPQDENIRFQIRSTQILRRHTHTLYFEPPSVLSSSFHNLFRKQCFFRTKTYQKTVPNERLLR